MTVFDQGGSDIRRLVCGNGAGDAQNDAGHEWEKVRLWRRFAFVDKFPEVLGLAQDFIFPGSRGNIGAEQEIVQAVGVQNAVDDHFAFDDFKVNAVIFGDVAIKNFTILSILPKRASSRVWRVDSETWKSPSRSNCSKVGMLDTSAALILLKTI